MRYNKKYIEKILNDPLPPLEDDDKIYLTVPYMGKGFAKCTNCEYDKSQKEVGDKVVEHVSSDGSQREHP